MRRRIQRRRPSRCRLRQKHHPVIQNPAPIDADDLDNGDAHVDGESQAKVARRRENLLGNCEHDRFVDEDFDADDDDDDDSMTPLRKLTPPNLRPMTRRGRLRPKCKDDEDEDD